MRHGILEALAQRDFDPAETYQLIRASGPICWSWGMSEQLAYSTKALSFKVNGHHHQGYVVVILGWDDTYTVHYLNDELVVLDSHTDIYFEDLVDTIDIRVEKIESYS